MKSNVFRYLRIACCISAALLCAAAIFVFVYCGWQWGLLCIFVAAAFAGLMFLFKHLQEKREEQDNPKPGKGDFINGPADGQE